MTAALRVRLGILLEYVARALKQTSREAIIQFYLPALDPAMQKMTEQAEWGVRSSRREFIK
jgi:hypothetical protein